jgi:drug/metabolite transporter (DMT)-like permease
MTLDYYSAPPSTTTTHDRVYTILLGCLSLLCALGSFTAIAVLAYYPPREGDLSISQELIVLIIYGLVFLATFPVLLIRVRFPTRRKRPTWWLNIALLIVIPLGTILAVYGLWKVDKKLPKIST